MIELARRRAGEPPWEYAATMAAIHARPGEAEAFQRELEEELRRLRRPPE